MGDGLYQDSRNEAVDASTRLARLPDPAKMDILEAAQISRAEQAADRSTGYMDEPKSSGRSYTRRQFLKGVSLGITGAVVATTIVGRLLGRRSSGPPAFPEGSIYTPDPKRLNRL